MSLEVREPWLAQRVEEILEPERRIVDTHLQSPGLRLGAKVRPILQAHCKAQCTVSRHSMDRRMGSMRRHWVEARGSKTAPFAVTRHFAEASQCWPIWA
jgi:hypothetical protein